MSRRLLASVMLLSLGACAGEPVEWAKPGATPDDYQRDWDACGSEAAGFNTPVFDPRTMSAPVDRQAIQQQRNSCMFGRGWTLAPR